MAPIGLKAVVGESKTFFFLLIYGAQNLCGIWSCCTPIQLCICQRASIYLKRKGPGNGGTGCGWLLVHLSGDDDNGEGDVPLYPDVNRRGVVRKHWMPCGGCSVSLVSCGADAQLHFKRQSVKNAVDKR